MGSPAGVVGHQLQHPLVVPAIVERVGRLKVGEQLWVARKFRGLTIECGCGDVRLGNRFGAIGLVAHCHQGLGCQQHRAVDPRVLGGGVEQQLVVDLLHEFDSRILRRIDRPQQLAISFAEQGIVPHQPQPAPDQPGCRTYIAPLRIGPEIGR